MLRSLLGLLVVGGLAAGAAYAENPPAAARPAVSDRGASRSLPAPTTSHHYIANIGDPAVAQRWGFTVLDTGSSPALVRALPRGTQALVYLGQDCPTRANATFRHQISRLADNPRVFGYYLADEPVISGCSGGPAALRTRTDYIRRASGGKQKSFIVVDDPRVAHAYRPRVTHLTMVGIDPYPCSVADPSCDFTTIRHDLDATLRAGVPLARIVPVYEGFGQENTKSPYYTLPTAAQMTTMLQRWAALVPHPMMDYVYSWGHQSSANPTLRDSSSLKQLFKTYFAG